MKKILLVLIILLTGICSNADIVYIEQNVNMDNFWVKNGKETEKILLVSRKVIHENNLKRAPIFLTRNLKTANAYTNLYTKSIDVTTGLLPYIDNDDECAFVVSHELAHAQNAYEGVIKLIAMQFNSKKYEYEADSKAIDYMVKAGYNPIAAIIVGEKIFNEPLWDWGFLYTHPKGTKRLLGIYKYIYTKYPSYLNTDMAKSTIFKDFLKQNEKEISSFIQSRQYKKKVMDL